MAFDHDITAGCWAVLGRRGDSAAMTKAKKLVNNQKAPWDTKTSDNIRAIHAVLNAAIWRDYKNAMLWFSRARDIGIGEGGPLYWPAGDVGYIIALTLLADEDGEAEISREGREYLSWCVDVMRKLSWTRPGAGYVGIGPGPKEWPSERNNWLGEEGYVAMPGARAVFSGHLHPNWYAEGPGTNVYQCLQGIEGRVLSGRYAEYKPGGSTWDSWPWLVAQIRGWIPASRDAQPTRLARAFRSNELTELLNGVEPGPYRLRFGLDVVRGDHWLLMAASHLTAAPKPPATWIEWADGECRIALPDGYRNYGNTGRGSIEWTRDYVWAEGRAAHDDETVTLRSKRHDRAGVREHWVLSPRATRWGLGALHPSEPRPEPEPPPDEDDDRRWYQEITDAIRDWWRSVRERF